MSGNPFIEEEKNKLKESLSDFFKYHPEYMNEFIQLCADHLHQYREECKKDLDATARMAIEGLLTLLEPEEEGKVAFHKYPDYAKVAMLIRGMRLHYPNGIKSLGLPSDRKMMELFLDLVKKENTFIKNEWILKHNNNYDWLKMVLEQTENKNWQEQIPKSAKD